jgi:hypothetical protein
MEPVGDLLGDQGGIAADAVVDDEVDRDLVVYGFVYDSCRVIDHHIIIGARYLFYRMSLRL